MQRYALGLEYDGTAYSGWQIQSHAPSIQNQLNRALGAVADHEIQCVAAGRTDAGVHATGQVAHFESGSERAERDWLLGANSNLPDDINVRWVCRVTNAFQARYSALSRTYRYRILNRPVRSALERHRAWWLHSPLDTARMARAAKFLLGEHDFTAFRAAACQSRTPRRHLQRLDVWRDGDRLLIECEANAFLHHMVRNIVGSLVRVGRGDAEPQWIEDVLRGRQRHLAGMTAPAAGLCLTAVQYPPEFGLPETCGNSRRA